MVTRQLTSACARPRFGVNVIASLAVISLDARRVMPGVGHLRQS